VRRHDILLHHPYDSYDAVLSFIQSAAEDERALSIKQTLYRTSEHSLIVPSLMTAAEHKGWKPEPNSDIVRKLQEVHKKLLGEPAKLIAMHAGLECGVIGEKYPGMQMVSFGPTIVDPHSPNERVQISSVETFWNYLKLVLENM
jgi:di/tripeptidase